MKFPKKSDALVGEDKSLEEEEENYLNPEDLSIVDEKTWEPTDEEILSYALKLGYDIEKDPDELFEVAYYYMKYPLPEGWKRAIYKKTKELVYINMEDGEIEVATEIEEMAHQMYLEKKEEMFGKKDKGIGSSPISNKIPPINEKKSPSLLPPVKEKNGSKNSLLSEIEKELEENKAKDKYIQNSDKEEINIALLEKNENSGKKEEIKEIIDIKEVKEIKEKDERRKSNEDIFGISQKPVSNNNIIEKESLKENIKDNKDINKDKKEKDRDIYGIHAEESEEEKEYGDDFDFDGIEDDSEHKGEPLIKSIINKEKEKEKEKEKKDEIEKLEKEKKEKEKKEKELKERLLKEEQEKKEKLQLELEKQKEKEKEKELNEKLMKEKKDYLNKKLKELQSYKEERKKNYEKVKNDKKSKNNKLKEEYEIKYKKDLANKKQKLQSEFNQKLEFFEAQLINKKLTEEKKYRENKEYTFKEKQKELKRKKEKENEDKNIRLKEKKSKLIKEIREEKYEKEKQEANYKEKKIKIQNNIKLLDQKKKIDITNLDKKLDLSIKDYEIDCERKFLKEKEQMKELFQTQSNNNNNINTSSSNLNFSLSGINNEENNDFIKSKILDNIQKAMDEEYDINCRSIEQDLINNKMKEIEKYNFSLSQEKEEKSKKIKNDINIIEKEYYKSISEIRQIFQNKKNEGDNYIKIGFEQTLKQNEETKNKISSDNKTFIELFLQGIQKLISKNNTIEQTEIQIEEFLMQLKDNYHMTLQKNKNTYEIAEYDYKQKKIFIKYLLDVINYLGKIFSSANTDIFDVDKNIAENLLKFCKDKISNYKIKFQNKKKKRVFKFINENLLGKNSYLNMSDFDDTRESSSVFVNSFKRKSESEIGLQNNDNMKNDNFNFINRINIEESINNINKNSFIFKNNINLAESFNNFKKINTINNLINNDINNNYNNNYNLYRTQSQNEINYHEQFFKTLNKDKENEKIKLEYYTINQNYNYIIPLIPEKILDKINEDILNPYSEIVLFLKNEYSKLIEIDKNKNNKKINIKLNLLILDKIKIYVEEAFNYIINNYYKKEKIFYIEKKIQIVKKHIEDFKTNFNVDKYLTNSDLYNSSSTSKRNNNINGQNNVNEENINDKDENNGMNNLILNGKFNISNIK